MSTDDARDADADGPERVVDLLALREGDRILWDGRTEPLTVIHTTLGSHVIAEGSQGARYQLQPDPREDRPAFRLAARGGRIENLRVVDPGAGETVDSEDDR